MNRITFPLKDGMLGPTVADLQDALQQCFAQSAIPITDPNTLMQLVTALQSERTAQTYGPGTHNVVAAFQQGHHLVDVNGVVSGAVDEPTASALNALLTQWGLVDQPTDPAQGHNALQGALVFDNGLPAAGLTVRLFDIGFNAKDVQLGQVVSDAQGKYSFSYTPPSAPPPSFPLPPNLQVRVLDANGKEVTISATKFNAGQSETMNLIVPVSVRPLAPEFQRLSADISKVIGDIALLGQAQENALRQDLTLLNQATNWDARLIALAATAAQQTTTTGLGIDVLYALFRVGLPTDPTLLAMVPADTVQKALSKATAAGIVTLNADQISAATTIFQNLATKTRLAHTTPGAVSSYGELFSGLLTDPAQQAAFADLYLTQPSAPDFWKKAADLGIPAQTLDAMKLQGKFFYLTFNNAPLAQKLHQDIGASGRLSDLVRKDYHLAETWQSALTVLAGPGGDQSLQKLIPGIYSGATTADRLAAYSADLARKVRLSFPTETVSRMIERKDLPIKDTAAPNVTAFLYAAAALGYQLGRTPLNAFLKTSRTGLPQLDAESIQSLKTVHRLYQVTPSSGSLQAALKLGFTSAYDIAKYPKDTFMQNYAQAFPPGEAALVYGQSQTVSSVTFNFFSMAKQLDTAAPVYALSGSETDRQNAKNAIIQQFPTMASLFGNLDYCQCEDCRSVLSPAAYFVDLLDFLNTSPANPITPVTYADPTDLTKTKSVTPLDVLIGNKDAKIGGRRPDLGALPLTCENTNTALPYIDLVNEIFEYYIANNKLDANAAYDTGEVTTEDLSAEPQHILPSVYNSTLKQALYPLNLPFDLWIETVREFLNYFKIPLAQVLDVFRPASTLELFSDTNKYPYYRAQILAESLGLSPAEYDVLTVIDPTTQEPSVQNWFQLYGYQDEATALKGKPDPTDPSQYLIPPLSSAKNLSQRLGLSYQELTDLVTTGFLNPGLYPLIFQFRRFGIEISDVFSYTGQPGYPALTSQAKTDFENLLHGIETRYKGQNPTFNAITWINNLLPANYSKTVLVLADPNTGCDFSGTTLQYADGSPATSLDYVKFNLFVRLWKKLGWSLDETDRALQLFFPSGLPAWSDAGFAAAFTSSWKTALVYLAHLDDLNTRLAPAMGRVALLPLWTDLPAQGSASLYAQLFLASSVLNNDGAFDDPNGAFPTPIANLGTGSTTLPAHQATVQGVLGLTADEVSAILADAGSAVTTVTVLVGGKTVAVPSFTLTNLSVCYRYSTLAKCLQISVSDLIALKALSGLNPFQPQSGKPLSALADDVIYNQTLAFVNQVATVQNSGFSVEDLKYLLRQQFDPVGKYQIDSNVLITQLQTVADGLRQIQNQNAVPSNLASMSESLIDQTLSKLLPAGLLKSLFTLLTNSQTFTVSQGNVLSAIEPAPFAKEAGLTLNYDSVLQMQTVAYEGLLLNWKKSQLEKLNTSALFGTLMDQVQAKCQAVMVQRIGDILGVWASLAQYEAVETKVKPGLLLAPLTQADPALTLSYDQADEMEWLGYRGVLTDAKKDVLTGIDTSLTLAKLLANVQQQALPAYSQLVGSVLAMWVNVQTFVSTQSAVNPTDQIDSVVFFDKLSQFRQAGTITNPVPQLQFSYDSKAQVQTVSCTGVLTDAMTGQLGSLLPASKVLALLLQDVRNQAVQLFQTLATGVLTVSAADLDTYSLPLIGLDALKQQKQVKAELVRTFLPLVARKLSRQLIVQTLSSSLAADPGLIEALATDAALLSDPANAGQSTLATLLAVGQQGVSAFYYDGSATLQATGIAATTDTADPSNNKLPTASAHFEGYLQVPTDGPYRFFAELGDVGAAASLTLDSPDPSALFNNPIISPTVKAAKSGDEVSRFVQLKGGVAYHYSLDFSSLGSNGAGLLIQGETLPKGPLSQVFLYPQQSVVNFIRARSLLSKVIQILQTTGLDLREISYLVANAAQFSNLRFSALPTRPSDDSPANAVALFSQFLTLADYADLRKGPAGGSDGLVDVFQAAAQTSPQEPNTPWTIFANLTRRDPKVVNDAASALGPEPHFANNVGIRRVWEALQLIQIVGIPGSSIAASTLIAAPQPPTSPSPDQIATSFKNAVRSRFTAVTWRPIAQSIFDKLRQKKRDALAAYLVNVLGLESPNQLFEYFLVDSGMEPVVQTSRVRLALSSVQTFIQRCLLNLETGNEQPALNVFPGAIDANWWEWMKRYRVWQASREIFLFPENWMEPELRLDKSDLFQTLESTLLQGDVNNDLVEGALYDYLQGLDDRARLDIVASYLEQNPTHPGLSTLHVLGRTYDQSKYFYRTYSSGTWTPWEAVSLAIQGDHIVLAVWRGKLNLFWVRFFQQSKANDSVGTTSVQAFSTSSNIQPQLRYQLQLSWSEYSQGKWSNPIVSDVSKMTDHNPVPVDSWVQPNMVLIHVSKEAPKDGSEGAIEILLDFPTVDPNATIWLTFIPPPANYMFRVTGKNCDLLLSPAPAGESIPKIPYNTYTIDATQRTGQSSLTASFQTNLSTRTGQSSLTASFQTNLSTKGSSTPDTEQILKTVSTFALLTCSDPVAASAFLDPSEPMYQEAGSLISPFFFKDMTDPSTDNELTFFVQPSLTEETTTEWNGPAIPPVALAENWADPGLLSGINVLSQVPITGSPPVKAGDAAYASFPLQNTSDWMTIPATTISYGGVEIGKGGAIKSLAAFK